MFGHSYFTRMTQGQRFYSGRMDGVARWYLPGTTHRCREEIDGEWIVTLMIISSGHVPRDWGEDKEAWVLRAGDSIFQGQGEAGRVDGIGTILFSKNDLLGGGIGWGDRTQGSCDGFSRNEPLWLGEERSREWIVRRRG